MSYEAQHRVPEPPKPWVSRLSLSLGTSMLGVAGLSAAFLAGASQTAAGASPPAPVPMPSYQPVQHVVPQTVVVTRTVPAVATTETERVAGPAATVTERVTATETTTLPAETVSVPAVPVTITTTVTSTVTVPGWP